MKIDGEKLAETLLKTAIVGIMTFGVTYLRGIGQDTAKLNLNLIQLKYEIRSLSENQNSVNKEIMLKLEGHETRIEAMERKKK